MELYNYKAKLIRIIDADTIEAYIDLGFHIYNKTSIRLLGYNAKEVRTKDLDEKALGLKQKAWLENLLKDKSILYVRSKKLDGFGRALGDIYLEDGRSIKDEFLKRWES